MKIIGILNVTPDSFSDGGLWLDPGAATAHGLAMWCEGADFIDVGAESTRPGSTRITAEEEWARLAPIVPALVEAGVKVSVDTVHSVTARRSLEAGVHMINDVSGGSHDPRILGVVADSNALFVVQHWRGFPGEPGLNTDYQNVVQDVRAETAQQVDRALTAGVSAEQIIVDPGLGFALNADDSWTLADNLSILVAGDYPVLVGASRKRFLRDRYGDRIEEATRLITRRCQQAGVWAVRVHDVAGNRQVLLT